MTEDHFMKIIGYNIKKYRLLYNKDNKKMTITKMSKLTNLPISYIKTLENNTSKKSISIKDLYKISRVLDIPISKFFEENNDK